MIDPLYIIGAYALGMLISGVLGFGGLLIPFALLGLILPDLRVLFLPFTLGVLVRTSCGVYLYRKNIHWPLVRQTLLWAIPMILFGAWASLQIPAEAVKKILGSIILFFVLSRAFPQTLSLGVIPRWAQGLWAAVWGFVSGAAASGGPIIVALFTQLGVTKEAFVGTLQAVFLASTVLRLGFYTQLETQYLTPLVLFSVLFLSLVGTWGGKKLLPYIPEKVFRQIVLVVLAFAGIRMLL